MTNNYLTKKMHIKGAFLLLLLVLFPFISKAQTDYSVTSIPHQIYTFTAVPLSTSDDLYSGVIPLTFDFNFFGNTYSQVVISTNGYIDFKTTNANTMSPWQFSLSIPEVNFPVKNSILGCYHDLYNNNTEGSLTYSVIGNAPYRRFVVLFDNQSHFSCQTSKSTFQMILYETLNTIDVQLINKEVCTSWNGGRAVTGIINDTGAIAFTPPGRNTGAWTAFQEGWRFSRPLDINKYNYTKCDDATLDGFTDFYLQVAQNDLLPSDPSLVTFYESEANAISQVNPITSLTYTNSTQNLQSIFANINGEVKEVVLRVVDCNNDFDFDTVDSTIEDVNNDTNLANDDTDGDGIPNFIDNDDDGDLVLTSVEYVFSNKTNQSLNTLLDTDNDGIPNYLDSDDDGDGVLTINEDYNGNHNPGDDDVNSNGVADYLDVTSALVTSNFQTEKNISIFPNPTNDILNVENKTGEILSNISIYSINGTLVKEVKETSSMNSVLVSDLPTGVYFVKFIISDKVLNYKFIKK